MLVLKWLATLCAPPQGLNADILLKQVTGFQKKWEDKAGVYVVLFDMTCECIASFLKKKKNLFQNLVSCLSA